MKRLHLYGLAACALASTVALPAVAEEKPYYEQPVSAPTKAGELTLGAGYTQPFGEARRGTNIVDIVGPAIGAELGLGFRIDPRFSLGVTAQYQEAEAEQTNVTAARGMTGGIDATYHFSPYQRLDPWVKLGTGYRLLWQIGRGESPTVLEHGFEIARAVVGFDLRTDATAIGFGPMVGADLNVFVWTRPEGGTSQTIADPSVHTFLFAGIQGRMDIGGSEPAPAEVAKR